MATKKGSVDLSALQEKGAIIWGKLPGFPIWPCRFTSRAEEDHLNARKKKSTKMDQVAVVFLGKYLEKAWIASNTVSEFTPTSMMDGSKYFNEKKFNAVKEADYRCAVKEAMRIVNASGITFPPQLTQMCAAWDEKEEPWIRSTRDSCVKCEGTEGSGPALYCSGCENASIHFHCAANPMTACDAYWYCDGCCDSHGKDGDRIYPLKEKTTSEADGEEDGGEEGDSMEEEVEEEEDDEEDDDSSAGAKKKKGKKNSKDKKGSKSSAKGKGKGGSDSLQSLGKDGEKDNKKGSGGAKSSRGDKSSTASGSGGRGGGNASGGNSKQQQQMQQMQQMLLAMQQSMGGGLVMMANGMMGMNGAMTVSGGNNKANRMGYGGNVQGGMPGMPAGLLPPEGGDAFMDLGSDQDPEENESTVSIDYCFVCGDGGTLVLCDFPQCARAYHQACIMPTFPTKLDAHPSNADLDDPWFCPAHHCSLCSVLETTRTDLKYLHLPRYLADQIRYETRRRHSSTHVSDAIEQKDLICCEGCPFSVCRECESDFAAANAPNSASVNYSETSVAPPAPSLFKKQGKEILPSFLQQQSSGAKAVAEGATLSAKLKEQGAKSNGSQHKYCLNCVSPNPHMSLAKILEAAWSRAAVTRNAMPFFSPLKLASVTSTQGEKKNGVVLEASSSSSSNLPESVNSDEDSGTASESETTTSLRTENTGKGGANGGGSSCAASRGSRKRTRDAQPPQTENIVPMSLLRILTKIRSLQYHKKDDFLADMRSLKIVVEGQRVQSDKPVVSVAAQKPTQKPTQKQVDDNDMVVVSKEEERDEKRKEEEEGLQAIKEHVAQTEKELSGTVYEDGQGNSMTVTADDKETILRALNNMLRLTNTVLRDRQHVISKLEVDLATMRQRGPRQQRQTSSEPEEPPDAKRSRSSSFTSPSPRSSARGGKARSSRGENKVDENDGVPDPAKSQLGAYALDSLSSSMEKLWRNECTQLLPGGPHKSIRDAYPTPTSAAQCAAMLADAIAPSLVMRPGSIPLQGNLNGEGVKKMNDAMKDVVDGYTTQLGADALDADVNLAVSGATGGAFRFDGGGDASIASTIGVGTPYHEYDYRQFDAAEIMYGLRDTNRGETVTLMEDASTFEQWDPTHRINELLATDETLVTLDKLREMTAKTLHLEARLRKEYLETKQFVRNSGIEKVTIGEVHLIKELKLANDDLRWRISNKNRAVVALSKSLEGVQRQLKEKDELLARQKDDLKHLRNEVEQAKLASMTSNND